MRSSESGWKNLSKDVLPSDFGIVGFVGKADCFLSWGLNLMILPKGRDVGWWK